MLKTLPSVLYGLAFSLSHTIAYAEPASPAPAPTAAGDEASDTANDNWDSEKRQAALRIQLFLDREGFGPGKIDGRWGGFTKKAAERWNESTKEQKIVISESGELDLSKTADIPLSGDMITTYEVTDHDQSILGSTPDGPEAMSKLKSLPYSSLMELVSEKFHADPDFIRELNALESDADLEVGSKVKVPHVAEPFDISEPMQFAKEADEKSEAEEKPDDESKKSAEVAEETPAPPKVLTVLRDQRVVEVREGDQLIHSFPISPGANDNQSPAGDWKVSVIFWMPEFRWDKSMLEDGTRSNEAYMLPPGPNNPVGIVWIGISADGIGLHGTPFPDAIGRNRSHGCIRLSNWDALTLAKAVTLGTRVIVK